MKINTHYYPPKLFINQLEKGTCLNYNTEFTVIK